MRANKQLSQNFLVDLRVVSAMRHSIGLQPNAVVFEIGAGKGALTKQLLPDVSRYIAVEIDPRWVAVLETLGADHLTVLPQDILTVDLSQWADVKQPLRVVGNLPYHLSAPILFHCLEHLNVIEDMHFLLQREFVQRMAAPAGSTHYGRLSVMLQYACRVQQLFKVRPTAFRPVPKVWSAVVRLQPYQVKPYEARDFALFSNVVKAAFHCRRKMLSNSLKNHVTAQQWLLTGIDPCRRPQTLTVAEFVQISNVLSGDVC